MNVKKVIPSGYCKGVIRAIELAKKTRLENKEAKIYVLGMIVHNRYVAEALKRYRIETLDDKAKSKEELLDKIDDGIVIFTAHGIADRIKKKAEDKGLKYVDASCDDVIATQKLVKEKIAEGYKVLYIGKKGHPEALAILSISEDIHLIASLDDLSSLKLDDDKIFVTNQTTMSLLEVKSFFVITIPLSKNFHSYQASFLRKRKGPLEKRGSFFTSSFGIHRRNWHLLVSQTTWFLGFSLGCRASQGLSLRLS